MLKILEPMALPILRLVLPSMAASPETNISGAEVPNPKIISPMINGDTLKILAIFAPFSVNSSALQIKSAKPDKRAIIGSRISGILIFCYFFCYFFGYYKGISFQMSETEFLIGRSGLNLQDDFYPDDLPEEWRFDYYSTLFKTLSLSIDTDEDLDQIFEEIEDTEEEFELVLSIKQAQLTDTQQLATLLSEVADYQQYFTLFCELDQTPKPEVMALLKNYQICFQSTKALALDLTAAVVVGKHLSFNQYPVLYSSEVWDEKQMRAYLEEASSVNTKTLLICKFAESEALNKVRIIAELLGF